jgi:DNA-binding NtrC family response regulator
MTRMASGASPASALAPPEGPAPHPIGGSAPFKGLLAWLHRRASADATRLSCGETGNGKTRSARAILKFSARRAAPFVPINGVAKPPSASRRPP